MLLIMINFFYYFFSYQKKNLGLVSKNFKFHLNYLHQLILSIINVESNLSICIRAKSSILCYVQDYWKYRYTKSLLDIGSTSIPVGCLSLLSREKRCKVFLVKNTFVSTSSGFSGLFNFSYLRSLLSDFTGLCEGSVLFSH